MGILKRHQTERKACLTVSSFTYGFSRPFNGNLEGTLWWRYVQWGRTRQFKIPLDCALRIHKSRRCTSNGDFSGEGDWVRTGSLSNRLEAKNGAGFRYRTAGSIPSAFLTSSIIVDRFNPNPASGMWFSHCVMVPDRSIPPAFYAIYYHILHLLHLDPLARLILGCIVWHRDPGGQTEAGPVGRPSGYITGHRAGAPTRDLRWSPN